MENQISLKWESDLPHGHNIIEKNLKWRDKYAVE